MFMQEFGLFYLERHVHIVESNHKYTLTHTHAA